MILGELPAQAAYWEVRGTKTERIPLAVRPPAAAEVVVEVAGSALGQAPGAEVVGRVVTCGHAAAQWLNRPVLVPRLLPCGECGWCRRAHPAACAALYARGAVATHETVPVRYLVDLSPLLGPERSLWPLAALVDAAATAYQALVRLEVGPKDLCVIVGAGITGRLAARLAHALNAAVVFVESEPELQTLAAPLGQQVIDAVLADGAAARAQVVRESAPWGLGSVEHRIVETTRSMAGRRRALEMLGPGDRACLLSGSGDLGGQLRLDALIPVEAAVFGVHACHPDLLPELCALWAQGAFAIDEEVSAWPFTAIGEAHESLRCGRIRTLPIAVPAS